VYIRGRGVKRFEIECCKTGSAEWRASVPKRDDENGYRLEIAFCPTKAGKHSGTIKVKTSVKQLGEVEIGLTGTAIERADRANSASVSRQ
jgi:hypothetical protein